MSFASKATSSSLDHTISDSVSGSTGSVKTVVSTGIATVVVVVVASVVVVVRDVEVVVVAIVEVEVVVIVVGWISAISVLPFVAAADPHNARSVVTAAIVPVRELRMNDALDILNHLFLSYL